MSFVDVHFHLVPVIEKCGANSILEFYKNKNFAISCAHNSLEYNKQNSFIEKNNLTKNIFQSFGIHPQLPLIENAIFLEELLNKEHLKIIGETGYDFFTEEYKLEKKQQTEAFNICLDFAIKYNTALIIHDRKALDEMFKDIKKIKRVPLVLFHSFAFSNIEASSILRHGVNAFFSFSKQILKGNKKSISCIRELPLERIFMETDSPFQTLKDEKLTFPTDIKKVYEVCAQIKKIDFDLFCFKTMENFNKTFSFL